MTTRRRTTTTMRRIRMMRRRTPRRESRTPMRRTELHRSLGVTLPGKSSHPFFLFSSHAKKNIIIIDK